MAFIRAIISEYVRLYQERRTFLGCASLSHLRRPLTPPDSASDLPPLKNPVFSKGENLGRVARRLLYSFLTIGAFNNPGVKEVL